MRAEPTGEMPRAPRTGAPQRWLCLAFVILALLGCAGVRVPEEPYPDSTEADGLLYTIQGRWLDKHERPCESRWHYVGRIEFEFGNYKTYRVNRWYRTLTGPDGLWTYAVPAGYYISLGGEPGSGPSLLRDRDYKWVGPTEPPAAANNRVWFGVLSDTSECEPEPMSGWLSVETDPVGVAVSIDGVKAGRSPVAWRRIRAEAVDVTVTDRCYVSTGVRIALKAGERRAAKVEAKARTAGLRVDLADKEGHPIDAEVTVDGVVVGRTGRTLTVPMCSKWVSVATGGASWQEEVKLTEGAITRVTARHGTGAPTGGMVRLEGGTYSMGKGKRTVSVDGFLLDVTEVTVGAYQQCVRSGGCPSVNGGAKADHPVVNVSWDEAMAYCAAVGKRLPTEEEWEWAARGAARGSVYPWGDARPSNQLCWMRFSTCPVGSHPLGDSPHGVKDLAGSVWEWTSSSEGGERVLRGGGWTSSHPGFVSAESREVRYPFSRSGNLGFRCAKTP